MKFNYIANLLGGREEDIKQYTIPQTEKLLRDGVFVDVLESFDNKPIDVFQVGAIESLDVKFRIGSGWSDLIFGKYIKEHGGSIVVVDIDLDHIAHSFLIANSLGHSFDGRLGDAIDHIETGFDIYYLDGADIPLGNQQTMDQFMKIKDTSSVVIIDDTPTKGVFLQEYLKENNIPFDYYKDAGNGMMVVDLRRVNKK